MGYPRGRESFCYIFFVYAKEFLSFMAEKLKIIPLGGLNEIGKNMTVYEYALWQLQTFLMHF